MPQYFHYFQLAEAGWYMIGSATEPDLVRGYYCLRELDGWDPEDDPWEEHQRRSGDPCPFILKGKKARDLTIKDALELEGERACFILKKRTEEANAKYREEAEKIKSKIMQMGQGQIQKRKGKGRKK